MADIATQTAELAGTSVNEVQVESVNYPYASPATAGLWHVTAPGQSWCVKAIHHPRHWPGLVTIPEFMREQFMSEFPWRFELDMALCGISEIMPPGLRTARLDHVNQPDDEHATMWWEWIDEETTPWNRQDYVAAARSLGRLAARRREGADVNKALPAAARAVDRGFALRIYTELAILDGAIHSVRSPQTWEHPLMVDALQRSGDADLRNDALALADRLPSILDQLDDLPQTYAHGDASPQNLLRPLGEDGVFVAIDWGFGSLLAVGFDLGQLLVGLVHAGETDASTVTDLADDATEAYRTGLEDEGWSMPVETVRTGFLGSLACRSALDSLPLSVLAHGRDGDAVSLADGLTDAQSHVDRRLALTRVLLGLAEQVPT